MVEQMTCLVFDDNSGLRIGLIVTDSEKLAEKSPFLKSLWENTLNKNEVNVPINNFENQKDVVGFFTNVFYTNYVLKYNVLNLDWLEYSIYFQMDEIIKEYIKLSTEHINKVFNHYEETYTCTYISTSNQMMNVKNQATSSHLPETDLKMFRKIIHMSYKYEVMKNLHSLEIIKRFMRCPLLAEQVKELVLL